MSNGTTQGVAYLSGQESTFGTTASTIKDSYMEGKPSSWPDSQYVPIPINSQHHHFAEFTGPIKHSPGRPDALVFRQPFLRATEDNGTSDMARYFQSAGCNVTTSTKGSISGYIGTTEWDVPTGSIDAGEGAIVQTNDGTTTRFYPIIAALVATGATDTITPGMALPWASANSLVSYAAHTITPRSKATTVWETFQSIDRRQHTTNEGLLVTLNGCALSKVGDITLKPNEVPTLELTWHVASVTESNTALVDHEEDFNDEPQRLVIDDNFRVGMGTASSAGGVARANIDVLEARIKLGLNTQPKPGFGSASVGGWQGYDGTIDPENIRIELDVIYSRAYATAWELAGTDAGQTKKYIELCQPSTDADLPAFGFFFPNCELMDSTTKDRIADNGDASYYKQTLIYRPHPALYDDTYDNDEIGAAPWYIVVNARGADM